MSFVIPNVKLTKKSVPVMTDDTGKDLVDEIRRLRVALYVTHDDKPERDVSIKNLIEENESYKNDIEEYKDRIKWLENQNEEISNSIIKFLDELSNIFINGDVPDEFDYRRFMEILCIHLREAKRSHERFFKQNLLFHMYYGGMFTTKELKEYKHSLEEE